MTVAILHYHLRRGGVTRVIEGQSQALSNAGIRHIIAAGTPYTGNRSLPTLVEENLGYRDENNPPLDAETLLSNLENALHKILGTLPDIWHIHNHSLGKNSVYTEMVTLLAKKGKKVLLQLHDFAEDGRPANFKNLKGLDEIYPIAPHVHYGLINSRDQEFLHAAGLPQDHLHALPNPVTPPTIEHFETEASSPILLYPVRGIRRKNLGELCLLAALAPQGTKVAVSLPPENEQWQPIHDRWGAFAKERDIPLELAVVGRIPPIEGAETNFQSWLSHSTHLVTTSIAEGFGLAFLEPVALEKPLIGRDLPKITRDFKQTGLQLGNLYQKIPIPLDLLDLESLRTQMENDVTRAYQNYQRNLTPEIIERTWHNLTQDNTIDFGNLPESFQESVIKIALSDPNQLPFTNWIKEALQTRTPSSTPSDLTSYTLETYQKRLLDIYSNLAPSNQAPLKFLPKENILNQFLKPEQFHFLRT